MCQAGLRVKGRRVIGNEVGSICRFERRHVICHPNDGEAAAQALQISSMSTKELQTAVCTRRDSKLFGQLAEVCHL